MSPSEDDIACPTCWRIVHRQHEDLCPCDDQICISCHEENRHDDH